jgi:phage head maturation protease
MDFKTIPQFLTKAIADRTVAGIFAVHGNVDDGLDRSHPGSFANATAGRDRVKHLWNHGGGLFDRGQTPPIAAVKSIREVSRADLPEAVLAFAPDATGGAEVTREYLKTTRADEILAGLDAGAIDEMSYAYDVTEYKFTEDDALRATVRDIYGMKLFDTSDVNWGMNPATVGKKSALAALPFEEHLAYVLATMGDLTERVTDLKQLREKDGRHLTAAKLDQIQGLRASIAPLMADLDAILTRPDPPKDNADIRLLLLDFERIQARINGVTL